MDGLARVSGLGFIKRLRHSQKQQHPRTSRAARMLVVDDPPAICAVLGKMLRSKGYEVLSATDVSMAIEVVRDKVPAWRDQRGDEAKRPVCMHTSRFSSGRELRADGPHPTGCG